MIKTKIKSKLLGLTVAILMVGVMAPRLLVAQSSSDWQQRIDRLNAEISRNQTALDSISHEANTLQAKVDALNAEIAQLQRQIDLAKLEIAKTQAQIEEAIAQLEKQKRIMFENAKTLYKIGNPTTIEILASSDNFSEFINRQEYLETVKEALNAAAREIVAIKEELEAKYQQLQDFVEQQKVQQAILQSKYDEQANLLAQTRGEEARYQALVANLRAQRNQAEAALLASRPRGGNGVGTAVRSGQTVDEGGLVGYMGDSGYSEGPHLHFALIEGGSYVDPAPYLNNGATWPVPGYTNITQPYGCQSEIQYSQSCGPNSWLHAGMDIGGPYGARIVASEPGTVSYAGCWAGSGFGNVVIVDHPSGRTTYYPHLGSGCR